MTLLVMVVVSVGSLNILAVSTKASSNSRIFSAADNWKMFRYGQKHLGSSYDRGPTVDVRVKWSYNTGDEVYSSPAVVGGRVYVTSLSGYLYCLDAETGEKIWETPVGNSRSSPAVVVGKNKVYVGSNDDKVYAVNLENGTIEWTFTTGGSVRSSPVFYSNYIYIGSNDDNIYAINANTGAKVWSYKTGGDVHSSPAASDGMVFVGSGDNKLYYFDADPQDDGVDEGIADPQGAEYDLIWTFQTGGPVDSSPATKADRVWVGSDDGSVYQAYISTGLKSWSYDVGGKVTSSPAIDDIDGDGKAEVVVGSTNNKIYAVKNDGTGVDWTFQTDGNVISSPAIADGKVYVGSNDGKIYCIDNTGDLIWSYQTGGQVRSSPAVYDNKVYVGSDDGYIYALYEWKDTTPPTISNVSIVVDGHEIPVDEVGEEGLWANENEVKVRANVTDDVKVESVWLIYSILSRFSVPMTLIRGTDKDGTYEGEIPPQAGGTEVQFYIYAEDNSGNSSKWYDPISYTVDNTSPVIENLQISPTTFSPDGDGFQDNTTITADSSEYVSWEVTISIGESVVRVLQDEGTKLSVFWNGLDMNGNVVSGGTYEITVNAEDRAFNPATPISGSVTVTFEVPTISNTTGPLEWADNNPVVISTKVKDDSGVAGVWLYYSVNAGQSWQPLEMNIISGTNLDGTYENIIPGQDEGTVVNYYILAIDTSTPSHQSTDPQDAPTSSYSYTIDTTPPVIENIHVSPSSFSPDNDGVNDTTTITADLADLADPDGITWQVFIREDESTIRDFSGDGTPLSVTWDGRNSNNQIVQSGTYKIVISAKDGAGNEGTASEAVTVENAPQPPKIEVDNQALVNEEVRIVVWTEIVDGLSVNVVVISPDNVAENLKMSKSEVSGSQPMWKWEGSFTPAKLGTYTVRITVTDQYRGSFVEETIIEVSAGETGGVGEGSIDLLLVTLFSMCVAGGVGGGVYLWRREKLPILRRHEEPSVTKAYLRELKRRIKEWDNEEKG